MTNQVELRTRVETWLVSFGPSILVLCHTDEDDCGSITTTPQEPFQEKDKNLYSTTRLLGYPHILSSVKYSFLIKNLQIFFIV